MSEVGALLEQLIMAPATMRLGLAKRVAEHFQAAEARLATAEAENERLRTEMTELTQDIHPESVKAAFVRRNSAEVRVRELESFVTVKEACRRVSEDRALAAESRLATAVGLLSWLERDVLYIASEARRKVCAFLDSAQPAAPGPSDACRYDTSTVAQPAAPARADEFDDAWTDRNEIDEPAAPARAEAEQAVLDAMASCTAVQLEDCIRLGHRIGGAVKPWGMLVAEAELARREAAKL